MFGEKTPSCVSNLHVITFQLILHSHTRTRCIRTQCGGGHKEDKPDCQRRRTSHHLHSDDCWHHQSAFDCYYSDWLHPP